MLDSKFLQSNIAAVKNNISKRFLDLNLDPILAQISTKNEIIKKLNNLRAARNKNAQQTKNTKGAEERLKLIALGKELKSQILGLENELASLSRQLNTVLLRIPNMMHPDVPVGKEDKDNLEIKRFKKPKAFDFKPKDHLELAKSLKLIDFDLGAKVAGNKFYYLQNAAVLLDLALTQLALAVLRKHAFQLNITPDLARETIVSALGFQSRGVESNIYNLEDSDLCLIGTAEITLGGMFSDTIVNLNKGPIRLAGLSHCFRKEAGAAGKYSKGLYRVHQFSKLEMFVICKPEDSNSIHEELLKIEEEIFQLLELPYRVVDTCSADLGAPAYRKYDIEAWMPGRGPNGDWGEVTSASNCTDFQARRLKCRFKDEATKSNLFVHTLNGTAIANSRALVAILENFQEEDGRVRVPKALQKFCRLEFIS